MPKSSLSYEVIPGLGSYVNDMTSTTFGQFQYEFVLQTIDGGKSRLRAEVEAWEYLVHLSLNRQDDFWLSLHVNV
ncbi:hypothetical protein OUZ56_000312 [Daphnia magna]|uniref:Uncharacterized protein n=1 Tax=Daphnia magna TaxID=35525 RepID=A0ABQ9ZZA7_9CRUS|nr:hypothetical protein OUZ56_000312 [Daphnia magna]